MALRIPAVLPQRPAAAAPLADNPAAAFEALFQQTWATAMHDLPFVNPALSVEAIGFRRLHGDWLGVVISPWFINLILAPGGGELWRDVATGEHRQIEFPAGPLEFIAENIPDAATALSAYQYCPLLTPVQHIADQCAAQAAAAAILEAIFTPPPAAAAPATVPAADAAAPRRAFLRRLVPGKGTP